MLQTSGAPPTSKGGAFGSASAIIAAFFSGRLRTRFYADVRQFGDEPDATRQIASGYMCLAAMVGWIVSFFTVVAVNPAHIEAHVLAAANAIGCAHGFMQIRRRRDPRAVMDWLLLLHLVTIAAISFRHAGIVAPVTASLPVLVGVTCLYAREHMRLPVLTFTAAVIIFCMLTAMGVIGVASPYTFRTQVLMTFTTMSFAALTLGGIAWIANIARDYSVHQLRAANELIVENASRSRVALEAARVGLWDVPDADMRKFHVSESFQTVTGYSAEEFSDVFRVTGDFVHPEDMSPLQEAFRLARKRMSRLRIDFRLKTKTRGYRWFSARARYSENVDGTTRISGSLQDINFIKAAEDALRAGRDRAREANKAKSDFIAVMSHEVRTPLNAILGSVEVLKRRGHDPETSELIGLIDDAGKGLLTIVSDLLDVSKIDAGKLEITNSATDLCALVTRTIDFWRPQASNKGLILRVDCGGADAGPLMVDAGRVRQIVGNLVSNAIKFTDTGTVTAILSTYQSRDGRIEIGLSVIDTGPGVPDALAETIFAPFEQAPSNASRGGTGLGLFISRRLARLMGGDLTLEPSRPKGAHFRLSLAADPANVAAIESVEAAENPLWHDKRVLCVDDNENNRRIAELLLAKFGIDLTTCASGGEALDICSLQKFDVILMDIVMPDMDGMETLRRLRSDEESLNRETPAIALTAKLAPEDLAAYAAAGFVGVTGKPINVRELVQAIAPFMADADSRNS
ncbi:MAG: response regulator [Hyphomonadaceae bacterium]|nr:response regulator [Hyphomonadaceae bacterium]